MQPDVGRVGNSLDILGESPVWCGRENVLYWVDIRRPALRRLHPASGRLTTWPMPDMVGSIGLHQEGGVVLAFRESISLFDPWNGHLRHLAKPQFGSRDMRFNDGRCDPQGRFWAGSMNDVSRQPVGKLYRCLADGSINPVVSGISVPNSLCWSPDGHTMYFGDTGRRTIYAYAFDPPSGTLRGRRVFARTEPPGGPDGATVDAHGYVWCAIYGAGQVVRYSPVGVVDRVIDLPVSQPTSCAFGGDRLDRLYVTTARQRLNAEEIEQQPWAGALLEIETDVRGLPEPRFDGMNRDTKLR